MSNILVFVLELIGTVAFAVSGAIVGIKKQMDLLGVIVLGVCTAVGGGIVRDLILGITPPATFQDPVYTLTRPPCPFSCSCRMCAPVSGGMSRSLTGFCW